MADIPSLSEILPPLGLGAASGFLGALARELSRTDRDLSWRLLPQTIAGLCAGTFGVALADSAGLVEWHHRFAVGFAVGMVGQAALMDAGRWFIRTRLGVRLPPSDDPPAAGTPER